MTEFVAPEYEKSAFNCPWCGAFSRQTFMGAMRTVGVGRFAGATTGLNDFAVSQCDHCERYSIWHEGALIYPAGHGGPPPHSDMPEDVLEDYREAQSVFGTSARSAAALLRLSLQKLLKHLGEPGENINADIGALVKKGLDANVQRALDIVRIGGNNAVHPGELDLRDDQQTVMQLFRLVNLVVQQMITQPREIEALWTKMPQAAKDGVVARDKGKERK
jgi:hypothetical protein